MAVRAEDVQRRSLVVRAVIWLAYGAVRALIGFTRYGGRDCREQAALRWLVAAACR